MAKEFLGETALARLIELTKKEFDKYPKREEMDRHISQLNEAIDGISVDFEKISENTKAIDDLKAEVGEISSALDELHEYAQTLVNGGAN